MAGNSTGALRTQNFRSGYLHSLGVQSVQVKDSLELILSQEIIDTTQFVKLVQQYGIPSIYRMLVWKLLLDLLPSYKVNWPFSERQRYEQFESMYRLVCVLNGHQPGSPTSTSSLTPELLKGMCLLTCRNDGCLAVLGSTVMELKHISCIASSFLEICDTNVDAYWLCFRFLTVNELLLPSTERLVSSGVYITRLTQHLNGVLASLLNNLSTALSRADPQVHALLLELDVQYDQFASEWFRCRFAGLFPPFALERIWDRLIADRSNSMCVSIAVSILINLRSLLLSKRTHLDLLSILTKIPECSVDRILERAAKLPRYHSSEP
eukprot:CFRG0417T1